MSNGKVIIINLVDGLTKRKSDKLYVKWKGYNN